MNWVRRGKGQLVRERDANDCYVIGLGVGCRVPDMV